MNRPTSLPVLVLSLILISRGTGRFDAQTTRQKPDADTIARLIQQLNSDIFSDRDSAAKQLEAIGEPALPALRRAAVKAPDLEGRRRAERLGELIDKRRYKLHPAEIAEGSVALFDGETTFGWQLQGEVKIVDGCLILGGEKAGKARFTTPVPPKVDLRLDYQSTMLSEPFYIAPHGETVGDLRKLKSPHKDDWNHCVHAHQIDEDGFFKHTTYSPRTAEPYHHWVTGTPNNPRLVDVEFRVPKGDRVVLRCVRMSVRGTQSIFNGTDFTGWKEVAGTASKCRVTPEGHLNIKGAAEIQTTAEWANFFLRFDVRSNGDNLKGGCLYRCEPGKPTTGYKVQIHNEYRGNRDHPVDFGTGAIYGLKPARKIVSFDNEWTAIVILAYKKRVAVWVNGHQTTDFVDTRPEGTNVEKNCKLGKGPISLQGFDSSSDISFRKIQLVELQD
jgi:hypothetical protein